MAEPLSAEDVRRIAKLARLSPPDDAEAARLGHDLSAILGYVERVQGLDLDGVEPMAHVGDDLGEHENRLRDDVPGPAFDPGVVTGLAPESLGPFIGVPKVIGEGGGA